MVNEINVEMLGEGVIDTGFEEIPIKNVYLVKNITHVENNDLTDTHFALKFYDNKDYYKVKKIGKFTIKVKKNNNVLNHCELLSPSQDIESVSEFKGVIKE